MNQDLIYIKKACNIGDKILKKLIRNLRNNKFKTEEDIDIFLRKQAAKHKCPLAFPPIVAVQENASEIHHKPSKTLLKKGFLIVDFGVKCGGYCSDCTRTFYLGIPQKKEKELYNLVLIAQKTALNHAQPGVYAADVDLIARAALQEYFRNFIHGLGHGVGKRIHQSPKVMPKSKSILKKGQIITIEPGLYFKNKLGIRIEDTILVKEHPIPLTKISKELITIKI